MGAPKRILNDVVIIRPLAIFLLVVWHSFIIYTGGWKAPVGYRPVESYWWIGKASYAFMLELFVFISGYVFALSLEKKELSFIRVVKEKFRRLIIPSLIFSTIYYLLFCNLAGFTLLGFTMSVLEGCGHLWFLPMLFWTTVICFCLNAINWPEWVKMMLVVCLVIFSIAPFPLGLSSALYYTLFFYVGMRIYKKKDSIKAFNWRYSSLLGILFFLLFIVGTQVDRDILSVMVENSPFFLKAIALLATKYIRVGYALCGIAFVYVSVNSLLKATRWKPSGWILELNATCFGIYLFQQFILQFLYYKSPIPSLVGPYWLPWIGLVVALLASYVLTKISLKTSFGCQLM